MTGSRGPNNVTRTHSFSLHLHLLPFLDNPGSFQHAPWDWPICPVWVTGLALNKPASAVRRMLCSDWPSLGFMPTPGTRGWVNQSPQTRRMYGGGELFPKGKSRSYGQNGDVEKGNQAIKRRSQLLVIRLFSCWKILKDSSLHVSENLPVKPLQPGVFFKKRFLTLNLA